MNIKTNLKETFYNELKRSSITLKEFCVQNNLNLNFVVKSMKRRYWFNELKSEEKLLFEYIENWLTVKQNGRVGRHIFDVKELQKKFKEYNNLFEKIY